jgi:hypothetical protein
VPVSVSVNQHQSQQILVCAAGVYPCGVIPMADVMYHAESITHMAMMIVETWNKNDRTRAVKPKCIGYDRSNLYLIFIRLDCALYRVVDSHIPSELVTCILS